MIRLTILFTIQFLTLSVASGQTIAKKDSTKGRPWNEDPICQSVFFGVLEGLYRDKVDLKIVDNIIGPHTEKMDRKTLVNRLRRSFVVDCPLCEPTFHAFLAYQGHLRQSPLFELKTERSTLLKEQRQALLSDNDQTRLRGLHRVVNSWLKTKFGQADHTPSELAKWREQVQMRFNEGRNQLLQLKREKDGNYSSWSVYWGCAACNAARDASDPERLEPVVPSNKLQKK